MRTEEVTLPWGEEELRVPLPEQMRIAGIAEAGCSPGVPDVAEETRRSLQAPIGCVRLRNLARRGMRITLLIDDATRPTPVAAILPPVLDELALAGVPLDDVTVLTALGVHRPMQTEEIAQRISPQWMARLRCENHDCDDTRHLVFLGRTTRGTPVWMNKTAAQADLIVSIGCIEPHVIASFGGGYKNVFPGVVGRETVARNHALNCTPETCNMVGRPIDGNPMRLDLEEGGRMLGRPVFIVNAVLNRASETTRIVAGDPIAAHRDGARLSAAACGIRIAAPADVVIAASHPMDQDLRQGVKALANTIRAVRPGGVHITFVRAREGLGVFGAAHHRVPGARRLSQLVGPRLLRWMQWVRLPGIQEEDRFFVYFGVQAQQHSHQVMYAPTVPVAARNRLPVVDFSDSPADAVRAATRLLPGPTHESSRMAGRPTPSFPAIDLP